MKVLPGSILVLVLVFSSFGGARNPAASSGESPNAIFGFRDSSGEIALERRFLAVPDAKLAEQHLRTLTQAPVQLGFQIGVPLLVVRHFAHVDVDHAIAVAVVFEMSGKVVALPNRIDFQAFDT